MKKSLKFNSLVYGIKIIVGMIFPLITFPYASRVLDKVVIGKVNFSNSIINYFVLFAGLGINSYAIREGTKRKKSKREFENFMSEMFSINCISSILSYVLFLALLFFSAKLRNYDSILLILSIQIALVPIGVEWFFNVFEEYVYITIRTIIVQVFAIMFLFLFVRREEDIIFYCVYIVLSGSVACIFNFIRAKKKISFRFVFSKTMFKHLIPISVLFFASIASQIYINADITMLGYIKTDAEVGIYSVASKVYNIARTLIGAFVTVSMPRLSDLALNDKNAYRNTLKKIMTTLLLLSLPSAVGIFSLSSVIVELLSGSGYVGADLTLQIMIWALPISVIGSILSMGVILPLGKEKNILKATCIGAVSNIILNCLLIPNWGRNGAAVATIIAEIIVLMIQWIDAKKLIDIPSLIIPFLKSLPALIIIVGVCKVLENFQIVKIIYICLAVSISVILYFCFLVLMKEKVAMECCLQIKKRILRKWRKKE